MEALPAPVFVSVPDAIDCSPVFHITLMEDELALLVLAQELLALQLESKEPLLTPPPVQLLNSAEMPSVAEAKDSAWLAVPEIEQPTLAAEAGSDATTWAPIRTTSATPTISINFVRLAAPENWATRLRKIPPRVSFSEPVEGPGFGEFQAASWRGVSD
jgi:hypothetical protein